MKINKKYSYMLTRNEIHSTLESMSVGESKVFPITELRPVRAYASEYGLLTGRRYETRTNRIPPQVLVTRRM